MISAFIGSSVGVIAGNFIYQAFCTQPDWSAALERSWFQLLAIIAIGLGLYVRSIAA